MNIKSIVLEIKDGRKFESYQSYFKENPNQVKELIVLVEETAEYPLQEYASWILVHICKSQKELVIPFYSRCIEILFVNENQSVRRNILNVIQHLGISDFRESEFIDLLISFIQNFENKVATQVYSMYILGLFTLKYPEIKSEIIEIIQLHSENKTPAYGAGFRGYLRTTKKIQL